MKQILIVDDDPINLKLFSIIAEKNNWSYDTATDGKQVEELVSKNNYQVVLLDIQLPIIDGFTLMKKFKETGKDMKIIAVTAYAMMGDKERILAAGADDYLAKPVNIEELVKKIKNFIK